EEHQVRFERMNQGQRHLAVRRFAYNFHSTQRVQPLPENLPRHRFIIDDQRPHVHRTVQLCWASLIAAASGTSVARFCSVCSTGTKKLTTLPSLLDSIVRSAIFP